MPLHDDGDGLSDEVQEDLKFLLTEDNTGLGVVGGWWCKPIIGVSVQLKPEPSSTIVLIETTLAFQFGKYEKSCAVTWTECK